MKLFLTLVLAFIITDINAQDTVLELKQHKINTILNGFKNDKSFKNASIGFVAKDIKTGATIASLNPDLSLMPASTLKVVTTATALEILGRNYRFSTSLEYSGKIDTVKNVLNGNLYIKGGGDPTLGSMHFDKEKKYEFLNTWTNAIIKAGIDSVNGSVIADVSRYGNEIACPKWLWEEVGNYYGAGAIGLSAFDNLYEIHFSSPSKPDSLTKVIYTLPEIKGLEIHNEVKSSNINEDRAYVYGSPYQYLHEIRGTIPKNRNDFTIKGAMPDPPLFLANYFVEKLQIRNIKINGKATTSRLLGLVNNYKTEERKTLFSTYSPELEEIIYQTNKKSINLFAEHLLIEIGYAVNKVGNYDSGLSAVINFWQQKGMDTDGFYIYDGSGLSRSDAVTANQMVFILTFMKKKSRNFEAFYNSLPIAGKSGTITSIGKNTAADGNLRAKSGSIDRVRAYSGYVTTKSGRELAFSINISNYNCSDSECRNKLEELMVALAEFNL
ncbi:MAG: D-alanyl-D-alanine carboxypeptidase/D-alanyl-D-alanine-endopeptidase [Bacteroidales bacterium]